MKYVFNLTLLMSLISFQLSAAPVVIVNINNQHPISKREIVNIFMGKQTHFSKGGIIQAYNLKNPAAQHQFQRDILGKSPHQVKAYWSKLLFTGRAIPPKMLTQDEMLNRVATHKNAIGYIDERKVTKKVKVIYKIPHS